MDYRPLCNNHLVDTKPGQPNDNASNSWSGDDIRPWHGSRPLPWIGPDKRRRVRNRAIQPQLPEAWRSAAEGRLIRHQPRVVAWLRVSRCRASAGEQRVCQQNRGEPLGNSVERVAVCPADAQQNSLFEAFRSSTNRHTKAPERDISSRCFGSAFIDERSPGTPIGKSLKI